MVMEKPEGAEDRSRGDEEPAPVDGQFGRPQGLHLRLQPEADADGALAAARPLAGEAFLGDGQENGGPVPRQFHIQEKDEILAGEGPARHDKLLALPHAEKGTAFQRPAADPEGFFAGIPDQQEIGGTIDAEGVPLRLLR